MADWFADQLAKARARRFGVGRHLKRGRKYVAGKPQPLPMPTLDERRPITHGATKAAARRDAERKQQAHERARRWYETVTRGTFSE